MIDTSEERKALCNPHIDHLSAAREFLDVIDAQAAEIERLKSQVADFEAAISAQEDNDLYTGGNLWRFWADKAAALSRSSQ